VRRRPAPFVDGSAGLDKMGFDRPWIGTHSKRLIHLQEIRRGDSLRYPGIYYQSYHNCCVRLNSRGFMRHSTHFILLASTSYSRRYGIVCATISSSLFHSSNPMSPTSRSTLKPKYGNCLSILSKREACRSRRWTC
jgi:hypothetical protein